MTIAVDLGCKTTKQTNKIDLAGRKQKLLKYGNLIVPQICLLPKTQHDPNSFVVDVTHTSVCMKTVNCHFERSILTHFFLW